MNAPLPSQHLDLAELLRHVDHPTVEAAFPEGLRDIADTFEAQLKADGVADAHAVALRLAVQLAWSFGGRPAYLPTPHHIAHRVQRLQIVRAHEAGATIDELVARFRRPRAKIYEIIREERRTKDTA